MNHDPAYKMPLAHPYAEQFPTDAGGASAELAAAQALLIIGAPRRGIVKQLKRAVAAAATVLGPLAASTQITGEQPR